MEGHGGVEMWRQVGSVYFPRNNGPVVGVEGAVRGYRVTAGHWGLGWDVVPLCRGHGTLSLMCGRFRRAHTTFVGERNTHGSSFIQSINA